MARYETFVTIVVVLMVACSIALAPFTSSDELDPILLQEASYDKDSGTVTFSGTSSESLVNVIVIGPSGNPVSPVDPCVVSGSSFGHTLQVGQLQPGTYKVIASASGMNDSKEFVVQGSTPQGSYIVSSDGKVLQKVTGYFDTFTIPSGVTTVELGAFASCKINSFIYDRDVNWKISLSKGTFPMENTGISAITIGSSVSSIPNYLFAKTNIKSIIIPASVETIGTKAFYLCDELETVLVDSDSHLTTIGQYAFSSNNKLREVTFISSHEGYDCSILRGGFFLNPALVKVNVENGFNLISIGDLAFTKENKNRMPDISDVDKWSSVVNVNSDDGIAVPASVNSIGFAAFSWIDNIPRGEKEPGMNTMPENIKDSPLDRRILTSASFTISFAEGSQLGSLGDYVFSGYSHVSKIDLSNCNHLVEIGKGSFFYSVSEDSEIVLSNSVIRIGNGAFKSGKPVSIGSEIIVPANVQFVGDMAFDCVSLVKFEEGSKLRNYMGSSSNVKVDLRNCSHLEYVNAGGKTSLPAGLFVCEAIIIDKETPLATMQSSNLIIGDSTVAIDKRMLENARTINCSEKNDYFTYEDDMLIFSNAGESKLIAVMSESSTLSLMRSGLVIENGTIPETVNTLIVGRGITFSEGFIDGNSSLESIIFTHPLDGSWDMVSAFKGGSISKYYVDGASSQEAITQLSILGDLYFGYVVEDKTAYVPNKVEDNEIVYSVVQSEAGVLILKINDTVSRVLLPICDDADVQIMDGKLTISNIAKERITVGLNTEGISIVFDGNGGTFEGKNTISKVVPKGSKIVNLTTPQFIKNRYNISGWSFEMNGEPLSESTILLSNTTLYACWTQRNPALSVDSMAASIDVSPAISGSVVSPGKYTFTCKSENRGYEAFGWIVNGIKITDNLDPIELDIQDDTVVSVEYRFYSSSSGLDAISNRGMPTSEDIMRMVQAYSLGGPLDNSSNIWKGHSSVPLIVDNRVYFRAGNSLYVAESDTGSVLKSVPSREAQTYYHSIGYGAGVIVDYLTSKSYDLNLNQLYVLERQITGAEYYDGYFYTSGSEVYRFTAVDQDESKVDEIKKMEYMGAIEGTYSSYGFTSSVFVDQYMYRIIIEGASRGIGVMDLRSKQIERFHFDCLESMFLDDGWISYYDGRLYMGAYSKGLFGAVGSINNGRLAYCTVDGLNHGEEKYYEFEDNGFVSQFLVVGGVGYVNCENKLYAFDMSLGELKSPRIVESSFGHGSMSIDISHIDEDGSPIYIYMIPYDGFTQFTFCIIKDSGVGSERHMERYTANYLPREWNSQTVRPDVDGIVIWYNDSGHIFTYTTPEKNPYYFFINDEENAGWYLAYGKNMYDAAKSLGDQVISIGSTFEVSRIFGKTVSNARIIAVHSPTDTIMKYDWVLVDSFKNRHFDNDHYIIITASSVDIQKGSEFTYWDGSAFKTYSFQENMGNRDLIGMQMVPGKNASVIRFYEGDIEFEGTSLIGVIGTDVKGDFPRVQKDGHIPVWKDSTGNVMTTLHGTKFVSGGIIYYLSWEKVLSYELTITKSEYSEGALLLDYVINTTDTNSLNVMTQVAYADKTFTRSPMEEKVASNGTIHMHFIESNYVHPIKVLITVYKGNILVLAEYVDVESGGGTS